MSEKRIFNNQLLFVIYGLLNVVLILILLVLLILIFNDIYILSRMGFIIFVGIHLSLLFFIKIHYLCIFYHEEKQSIEFHYSRRFGLKWKKRVRTVLLPLKQFDGYELSKDSLGIAIISFYKLERKERYALGPFYVGFISPKERKALADVFGESL
jgi:hypothetical protein